MPRGRSRKTPAPTPRPKRRYTRRTTLTGPELLRRYRNRTLVWCDQHGRPAADQTTPTGYIRPLTRAEEREAAIAALNEALATNPEFERCDRDGTPDPNGTHWQLREPAAA